MTAQSRFDEAAAGADAGAESADTWHIAPAPPTISGQITAVWRYRKLFWMLTVRALLHIYRGAVLGVAWMAINPLVLAIPAAFVVGNVFGISVDPLPLPLFILVGLAAWTLFRRCVQWMTKGMVSGRQILKRIYVPALLLLLSTISPGIFQLVVVLGIVVLLAIWYGPVQGIFYVPIGWHMLAVVPSVLMLLLAALGVGCFTSILNAFARDTWLTLRYVLSGWMLATPIVYPMAVIPEPYRWLAYLNPLTAPVELFRWSLLGYGAVPWPYLGLSAAMIALLLIGGLKFFATQQNRLFDHM